MKKTAAAALLVILGSWSCATLSPQYTSGVRAEMGKRWEEAIGYYEKAVIEKPRDPVYRAALERARFSASLAFLQEARALVSQGKNEEAQAAYAKAGAYSPRDTMIVHEARRAAAGTLPAAERKPSKIEFPIKLKAKDDPLQLRFPTETSLRSIFQAMGRAGGVNIVFDENFRDVPFTTDAGSQTFEEALKAICLATRNFSRIIDEKTVIIVPDQPMKRMQYEVNCLRTFYISNITAQDLVASLSQALRSATGQPPQIIFDKGLNSITVRSTPSQVELAERLIIAWDKPKAEVMIYVEIMEVSRTRLRQLGLSLSSTQVGLQYGAATTGDSTSAAAGWHALKGLGLGNAENYSISLPVGYLDFLESDSDTKMIAQPWLRGVSDEELRQLVGQKIPIPRTTFTPYAAGGIASQPIMNYEQQDVGIEVKITPKVHTEREVTIATDLKVTSIGGTGIGDIPIINTRELKGTMRLREGETQIIAGLLRDEERKTVSGIPGLKDIPGIGRLFGSEDTTIEQSDVIIALTPYIIRTIPVGPEDEKPFWVDIDAGGGSPAGGLEIGLLDREIDAEAAQRALAQRRGQDQGVNEITLTPRNFELPAGREFRVTVGVSGGAEIGSISMSINFNPRILALKDVAEGNLIRQAGPNAPFLKNIDNNGGVCVIGFTSPQAGKGVRASGPLATLIFESKAAGESTVAVTGVQAAGSAGQPLSFQSGQGQGRFVVR